MITLVQFIYLHPGKEEIFHQFEDIAIPLMEKYGGCMIHRIRPDQDAFIEGENDRPYEVHYMSFPSDADLNAFLKDESRKQCLHLKDASVRRSVLLRSQEA
ncbi:MAG: DUF1330 domain-containing protein [Bacteroidia bacterium]|nr:DUF1330 domain-containing protein [Bacteroidia bacterium]